MFFHYAAVNMEVIAMWFSAAELIFLLMFNFIK